MLEKLHKFQNKNFMPQRVYCFWFCFHNNFLKYPPVFPHNSELCFEVMNCFGLCLYLLPRNTVEWGHADEGEKRECTASLWSIPQMSATVRQGWAGSRGAGSQPSTQLWATGTRLSHHCCAPGFSRAGSWIKNKPGVELRLPGVGCRCHSCWAKAFSHCSHWSRVFACCVCAVHILVSVY